MKWRYCGVFQCIAIQQMFNIYRLWCTTPLYDKVKNWTASEMVFITCSLNLTFDKTSLLLNEGSSQINLMLHFMIHPISWTPHFLVRSLNMVLRIWINLIMDFHSEEIDFLIQEYTCHMITFVRTMKKISPKTSSANIIPWY